MNAAIQFIECISTRCKKKKKGCETVRVTVLVKKTYLGFLAATFITFIDIIYLAIIIFPDLFF